MSQHWCRAPASRTAAHLSPPGITPLLNDYWLRVEFLQDDVIFGEQPHCELVSAPAVKPGGVPGEAGGIKEQGCTYTIQFSLLFKSSLQGAPCLQKKRNVIPTAIEKFWNLELSHPLQDCHLVVQRVSLNLAYSLLKNYNSQRIKNWFYSMKSSRSLTYL